MLKFSALFQLNWAFVFLLIFIPPLFPVLYHKLPGKPFYVSTRRIQRGKYDLSKDILKKNKLSVLQSAEEKNGHQCFDYVSRVPKH